MIFVFGSNEAGRHGKGAAKFALEHKGAVYGVGHGPMGNCYAIPTKDQKLRPLPLERIEQYVKTFLNYARDNPTKQFELTPIGCGLAGYVPTQIAPLFLEAPSNVVLPKEFSDVICHLITQDAGQMPDTEVS